MPPELFDIIIGNVLAAVMLWLYIQQRNDFKEERELHRQAMVEKDSEIKTLNDSINEKVIQLLDEQRKFYTGNN
jgi:hypothetical protein